MTAPMVSILMVARDAAPFIDAALLSARNQTVSAIEVVVIDDGSRDETAQLARAHAAADPRVRVLTGPQTGLSAVRNASLREARGRFVAVLDSDDILHPRHLEGLLAAHDRSGAEICATNMVEFRQTADGLRSNVFAEGPDWQSHREIEVGEFLRSGMIGGKQVSLGYLKPLFDRAFLEASGIAYDERLRIGEDFDLVLRAMLAGARYAYEPQATYYYRRHSASTSHRLAVTDLEQLLAATHCYAVLGEQCPQLLSQRLANLEGARRQVEAFAAIKSKRWLRALSLTVSHREAQRLVLAGLVEALTKRVRRVMPDGGFRSLSSRLSQGHAEYVFTLARMLQSVNSPSDVETSCVL